MNINYYYYYYSYYYYYYYDYYYHHFSSRMTFVRGRCFPDSNSALTI